MKNVPAKTTFLKNYKRPTHLISEVHLCFHIDEQKTLVQSRMKVHSQENHPLVLNGEDMRLLSVIMNDTLLSPEEYHVDEHHLTIAETPEEFWLEIENEISPINNSALEGLYQSGDILCTQCEPHGFRRITYFLDRSDIMAKFTTKIIANKAKYPILLSNGNEVGKGDLPDGKHWSEWYDPFPKPTYLFALVAGDFGLITDRFVTMEGREVELRIYCDHGNEYKCDHAMRSLKKAMKWDEETFGLEYDLDIFMIVAVDAFNYGAMENKGLNIFNTNAALAHHTVSTDDNFLRVEGVVAHEYFHNWTGNRVTCRDWFQLTLKEGLTVYRDQEFSSDMNSRPAKRIEEVLALRTAQFPEDAGPTAHPIKPQSYIQVNNFYTPTVYNKGAEVIRMIATLIGKDLFRKGIETYFQLYDGQAVTTEDFIHAMEVASNKDFSQFSRWYSQAGTPQIHVDYSQKGNTFTLTVEQSCPPTADNSEKQPFHFPLSLGLVAPNGVDLVTTVLDIKQSKETFTFENVIENVVPSINRDFSAPIIVHSPHTQEEMIHLMIHDSDAFNRWDASQELFKTIILEDFYADNVDPSFIDAVGKLLKDESMDLLLKAEALLLPSETELGTQLEFIDFDGIHRMREYVIKELAKTHRETFFEVYHKHHQNGEYKIDPVSIGKRKVKNACLYYLSRLKEKEVIDLCVKQFNSATNMTDELASLSCLANTDCQEGIHALHQFYNKWKHETLVMDKWIAVQVSSRLEGALERVKTLRDDPVFNIKVPNMVRSLFGSFTNNHVQFHDQSGEGYRYIADAVLELDELNPMMAASVAGSFKKYPKLDGRRKEAMKHEIGRILGKEGLSNNVYEIVSKSLKAGESAQDLSLKM